MSRQTPFFAVLFAGCSTAPVASKPTPPPAPEPVAAAPAVEEWPEIDNALIEQQALTRGFRLGRPSGITLTPEGDAVLFLRTGPRSPVGDLYVTETATGATKKLLSASDLLNGGGEQLSDEEKARRERKRISTRGLVGFDLSDDGRHLLVPLSGRLYVVDRADAVVHELPATAGEPPIDARFSPDARKVAMVRDGDLYVMDVESGKDRRLTTRGSDDVENAVAEFVAQEEMDRREGYWWSPDGKHLVYQHSDLSKVDTLNVSDPANPDHAPVPFRYPRPGRNNADVTLGVIPAAGGKTVWLRWDRERFPYLVRVAWSQNAPLTVMVMNRRQTELVAYAADPKSGDMKELFRETDDAWINLDNDMPKWLPDGSGMLWATERAGWLQLELRGRDGKVVRALTAPELGYQKFAGIDEDGGAVWVIASPDSRQSHVYRVPLAGGEPERRTSEDGVHIAFTARRGGVHVVKSALSDGSDRFEVRRRDGSVITKLESVAEDPPYQANLELLRVPLEGREHDVSVVRPRDFKPGRRYPVIVDVYAGPTAKVVTADRRGYLSHQLMADAGFIVVGIDGRGTPGRGRDWERAVKKDLITIAIHDQAEVLKVLGTRLPELDLGRVGITGWSFGGYAAAMAVLLRPDVFHAAIAGAPVTDWRLYDTFYTERYMGLLDENQAGYESTSAITQAAKLSRPLLLIHGTTDDNVYFANSMQLADALFRAGRHFELLPLSGFTHMVPDPVVKKSLTAREVDFFRRNLPR